MSIFLKKHQLVFLLMLIMLLFTLFQPNFAFAQAGNLDNSPISRGLCNVFELVGGNIGKALAIFAIVMVGFGFFTGKFSIALVIGITLGIGILFGAPKIIAALTGEQTVNCQNVTTGDDIVCPAALSFVNGGQNFPRESDYFSYAGRINVVSASKSYISATIGTKTLFSLRCVSDSTGIAKWQFDDITTPIPASNYPFSGITLSTTDPVTNGAQLLPQPSVDTQVTINYQKICPAINKASLSVVASSSDNCASGKIQFGKTSDNRKVCVNISDTSIPLIDTAFAAQITDTNVADNKHLMIPFPGMVGQLANATLNGVSFTATCTAGANGEPGFWTITFSGSYTGGGSLNKDIIFN